MPKVKKVKHKKLITFDLSSEAASSLAMLNRALFACV